MTTRVLVVNAGSSSLKLRVLAGDDVAAGADLPAPRGTADNTEIKAAIESFGPVDAVGHRVVHGGTLYAAPVLATDEVRRRLESLSDLAPLHQPKSLAAMDAVRAVLPDTPAVACFDTAFHATIPAAARRRRGTGRGIHSGAGSSGCATRRAARTSPRRRG